MIQSAASSFFAMPKPAQFAFGGMGFLTVGGVVYGSGSYWLPVLIAIVVGVVLIVAVLLLYGAILRWREKKKSDPLEREILQSGGAVPTAVKDVSERARLDDMRKKFEQGVEVFRGRGKDLYSLPWYVIIGESGSGKTEAIRHCGIGFPPGLQNELQGTGGTINMDWWFTNHAVLLDTAGRLTFGEVNSTDTREWREFLALMRKNRPNCPINGLLVAIPAESLLQDEAEELDRKGGRLARQLDLIQSTLGVRFPVFVLVTKADYIPGFRAFFEDLHEPDPQGQLFGWSNAADLDEPFEPDVVDRAVDALTERLKRRRLGRLGTMVGDVEGRQGRADELYAFPEEGLRRLGPRLRRYIEKIFVAGEWSSKPLFLRGVYFTSAMQEGGELDAVLAEAAGVPLEALQEPAWQEQRSYFLRDVFMEKVFRERGLVTRAGNTRALQRRRRNLVLGTGLVAGLLLMIFGLWAGVTFSRSIGPHAEFWTGIKNARDLETWAIADVDTRKEKLNEVLYLGAGDLPLPERDWPRGVDNLAGFFGRTDLAVRDLDHVFPFNLYAWMSEEGDVPAREFKAFRHMYAKAVLEKLVHASLARLHEGKHAWDATALDGLEQLIDIYAHAERAEPGPRTVEGRPFSIAKLAAFAFYGSEDQPDIPQLAGLQAVFDQLYVDGVPVGTSGERLPPADWPPLLLVTPDRVEQSRLQTAVGRYIRSAGAVAGSGGDAAPEAGPTAPYRRLVAAFATLEERERALTELGRCQPAPRPDEREQRCREWRSAGGYSGYVAALTEAEEAYAAAAEGRPASELTDRLEQAVGQSQGEWTDAMSRLLAAATIQKEADISAGAPPVAEEGDAGPGENVIARTLRNRYQESMQQLQGMIAGLQEDIRKAQDEHLQKIGRAAQAQLAFRQRADMYAAADAVFPDPAAGASSGGDATGEASGDARFGRLGDALRDLEKDLDNAAKDINALTAGRTEDILLTDAARTSSCVATALAGGQRRTVLIDAFARRLQGEEIDELVRTDAGALDEDHAMPEVVLPLTPLDAQGGLDDGFHPEVVARLIDDIIAAWAQAGGDAGLGEDERRSLEGGCERVETYLNDYLEYWDSTVPDLVEVPPTSWSEFGEAFRAVRDGERIRESFNAIAQQRNEASRVIPVAASLPSCLEVKWSEDDHESRSPRVARKAIYRDLWQRWDTLTAGAPAGAAQTLRSDPKLIERNFIGPQDDTYLASFTTRGMCALAAEMGKVDEGAFGELRLLAKFPFQPPVRAGGQYEPNESRELLRRIEQLSADARDTPPNQEMPEVESLRRRDPELGSCVGRILVPPGIDVEWIELVRTVRKDLGVQEATIVYAGGDAEIAWQDIAVRQGGKGRQIWFGDAGARDPGKGLGTLVSSGPGITIEMARNRGGAADPAVKVAARGRRTGDRTLTFEGPWALLLMLYEFRATTNDGTTWDLSIPVDSGAVQGKRIKLRIRFTTELPHEALEALWSR